MKVSIFGTLDVISFRKTLIAWGRKHFRPFPWRFTNDPYHILISEIMLHRTRAYQVVPVYQQFIKRYPSVSLLARATREELQEMLFSLGLHWRTNLICEMARYLLHHYNGIIPEDKEALLSLPGVSDYIAGAVRCFTWNYPEPLADTNTVRIAGRLFGLKVKDSSRRNSYFRSILAGLVDPLKPKEYNYALLDLADQVCTKSRPPTCRECPLVLWCNFGTEVLDHEKAESIRQ
jgi:A/G-specific adenine glycosylase